MRGLRGRGMRRVKAGHGVQRESAQRNVSRGLLCRVLSYFRVPIDFRTQSPLVRTTARRISPLEKSFVDCRLVRFRPGIQLSFWNPLCQSRSHLGPIKNARTSTSYTVLGSSHKVYYSLLFFYGLHPSCLYPLALLSAYRQHQLRRSLRTVLRLVLDRRQVLHHPRRNT